MLERIMIPLDGSPMAEAILTQVRQLLKRRDSEVLLVRVAVLPPLMAPRDLTAVAEVRSETQGYLRAVERRLADEGVRVRSVLREGLPADNLLEVADRERATLIAMTTHGRTGLARWAFGSVAEKLLRASDIPLLVMRSFTASKGAPQTAPIEEWKCRKILVPIDGSVVSKGVLPHVAEFAKLFGAAVLLLYVQETRAYPIGAFSGQLMAAPPDPRLYAPEDDAQAILKAGADQLAAQGVSAITLTSGGEPASQILELASQKMADLIAMSSHGRSGVSRWVLGSVTEKVLRAAPIPMLVVRSARTEV